MAPDEYSTGGGGRLKLKGSKVSDGRVEKKKKKKGVKKEKERSEAGTEAEAEAAAEAEKVQSRSQSRELGEGGDDGREQREGSAAKTEAERKYEEVRRKRVCFLFLLLDE